jgi:hypothetical protein
MRLGLPAGLVFLGMGLNVPDRTSRIGLIDGLWWDILAFAG